MTTALVLAGHGSHISPHTAGIVWQQVDALRARRVADEVTAAFWKEQPSFATVLNTLIADDITIVPLFTAQGYFTRAVIPAEMGLTGTLTSHNGRILRYTRTLGEHPILQHLIRQRVESTLQLLSTQHSVLSTSSIGVALIGHGTQRNPQSRAATEAQAQLLREAGLVSEVAAVYLDDTPSIPDTYNLLTTPIIIAVPNFLALGSHTTIDVPEALGLAAGQTVGEVNGCRVYYTDPIGVGDSLCDVIIELAAEAGAPLYPVAQGSAWDSFPNNGRDTLLQAVAERGILRFGQLLLTPHEISIEASRTMPLHPRTTFTLTTPAALREHIRMSTSFRPLASSNDLPDNWRVPIEHPHQLHAVVETVYPGAAADWAAQRQGTLTPRRLAEVIARQQGMFRTLADFSHTDAVAKQVCAACVRHPSWHDGTPRDVIPCLEPCNLWLSTAMEQFR